MNDNADYIEVVQAKLQKLIGYGRDRDEARSHAGFNNPAKTEEVFATKIVKNKDCVESKQIAMSVCKFHMEEDNEIPNFVKDELKKLISIHQYATAVDYCFNMIWDRGFEEN